MSLPLYLLSLCVHEDANKNGCCSSQNVPDAACWQGTLFLSPWAARESGLREQLRVLGQKPVIESARCGFVQHLRFCRQLEAEDLLRQDQLHNLQGPVWKENMGPLVKNDEEFQDDNGRALKQAQGSLGREQSPSVGRPSSFWLSFFFLPGWSSSQPNLMFWPQSV